MKTIELLSGSTKSLTPFVSGQRRLNVYFQVLPSQEKGHKVIIRGTPGYDLFVTLGDQPIKGFLVLDQILYAVAGSTLYSITQSGTITNLGTLSTSTDYVAMAANGNQIIIVTGANGYIYDVSANTLTVITSSGFPQNTTSVCFMNGFFIAPKPGTGEFYISDVYDGTTWDPLQFATAETIPDELIAVSAYHGILVLFGQNHLEFWQDTGGSPFPFSQLTGTAQDFGLAAQESIISFNNTIAFLGQNQEGHAQVLTLNGYAATRVSDDDIEHILNGFDTIEDAVSLTYMIDGHPMYQITFPSENRSFLYDALTNIWSEVQSGVGLTGRHNGNLGVNFNNKTLISDVSTGNIYTISGNVYTENGNLIKREVDTVHIEQQGNRFSIDELWLDFQLGAGLSSGQGSNPLIMLEVSKDNGNTFLNQRTTSIGMLGQYSGPRAIFRRFGQSRDFVFRISMTDPVPFVLVRGSAVLRASTESSK